MVCLSPQVAVGLYFTMQQVRSYKMITYTLLDNGYVLMDNDGVISTIPNDPANSDYQAYLAHEAAAK
jgi:hypothetical protein